MGNHTGFELVLSEFEENLGSRASQWNRCCQEVGVIWGLGLVRTWKVRRLEPY